MLEAIFIFLFMVVTVWIAGSRSRIRLRFRLEMTVLLLVIMVVGAYVIAKRFTGGLGAVTRMSDRFPWGIWIGADLCGVALAAGGFILAATVHIFNMRRFEPILRPAVLTSFLAYLVVAAILVLDLGRPYRFWHPLIMWQPHSVMFEITLCLTFYSLVLVLEFSPVIFERFHWHGLVSAIHKLTLPVVIIGVILSTLHQSSFGSLFLIVPQKLSRLWYTPILPILFFVSAVCGGIAVVMMESHLCSRFLNKYLPDELMFELSRLCSKALWIYLLVKMGDFFWRGVWKEMILTPWLGASFVLEIVGGILIPAVWLVRIPKGQTSQKLFPVSLMVVGGVVLNRLNISWFGLLPYTGAVYIPTWMELGLTAALVLMAGFAFMAFSRFLPVFPEQDPLRVRRQG